MLRARGRCVHTDGCGVALACLGDCVTVRELLLPGCSVSRRAATRRVHSPLLPLVGRQQLLQQRGACLSLVRAHRYLPCRPQFAVMDESTSALDVVSEVCTRSLAERMLLHARAVIAAALTGGACMSIVCPCLSGCVCVCVCVHVCMRGCSCVQARCMSWVQKLGITSVSVAHRPTLLRYHEVCCCTVTCVCACIGCGGAHVVWGCACDEA